MTTERPACGVNSMLPDSCRGRAEAFARSLHNKLRSLGPLGHGGGDDHPGSPTRTSTSSVDSNTDIFFDLDLSPQSPEEEVTSSELEGMIAGRTNQDNLLHEQDSWSTLQINSTSPQSDCSSDYFDPESFDEGKFLEESKEPKCNGSPLPSPALNGDAQPVSEPKKRPWNRVQHKYKAGTPEAMSEVSQIVDDVDEEQEKPPVNPARSHKVLAKLSLSKSSEDLLQESVIEQIKQGKGIPDELRNGVCPKSEATETLEVVVTTQSCSVQEDTVFKPCGICLHVTPDTPDPCADCSASRKTTSTGEESPEDDRTPRVRRCSSLKTGKTPPGTPGRKKIVRFADVLGLDLADVRTFLDEVPRVPTSAYNDLQDIDPIAPSSELQLPQLALAFQTTSTQHIAPFSARPTRILLPLFQQPGGLVDFMDKVRHRRVCLENSVIKDPALLSIAGTVRVRNLDFHKTVHIRYTTDGWKNYADLQATYVPNSCDGFSDKFTFILYAGHTMNIGQRLELAVRFQCKGQQYWDSNAGLNYCFQCLPASGTPPMCTTPTSEDLWKSFY